MLFSFFSSASSPLSPEISVFELIMTKQQRLVVVWSFVHNTVTEVGRIRSSRRGAGLVCTRRLFLRVKFNTTRTVRSADTNTPPPPHNESTGFYLETNSTHNETRRELFMFKAVFGSDPHFWDAKDTDQSLSGITFTGSAAISISFFEESHSVYLDMCS